LYKGFSRCSEIASRKRGAAEYTFFSSLRSLLFTIKTAPTSNVLPTLTWVINERSSSTAQIAWKKRRSESLLRLKQQNEARRSRSAPPRHPHNFTTPAKAFIQSISPREMERKPQTEIIIRTRKPRSEDPDREPFQPRARSPAIPKSDHDTTKSESSMWERAKQRLPFSRFGKE